LHVNEHNWTIWSASLFPCDVRAAEYKWSISKHKNTGSHQMPQLIKNSVSEWWNTLKFLQLLIMQQLNTTSANLVAVELLLMAAEL